MATIGNQNFRAWQIDRVKFRDCHGAFVALGTYALRSGGIQARLERDSDLASSPVTAPVAQPPLNAKKAT